jgi:hypothetical protein
MERTIRVSGAVEGAAESGRSRNPIDHLSSRRLSETLIVMLSLPKNIALDAPHRETNAEWTGGHQSVQSWRSAG